ncbi:ABC transporter ATP-binding protein [Enterococcus saccharolyticus]|uniref:Cobalt ABC transporter n=1 Tax=Candidatus Enterococcus willemsii TaxID=1857215 RepID=A0ABQ6Z166_9ENTE|nr:MULTISPECIES: ABC transporter ATP-binding protein [Enterococcus]KAF1305104.1 cobalt ABC transporter [Enterococcus sp. CU12B]MCD5002522.1 ABC transporter ATP-binding protein [Enterococcus saccharolyticus]
MALIELTNLSLEYQDTTILHQLNWQVKEGEMVVLCGKSGSGKSSLIKLLSGLIPELYEANIQGTGTILNQSLEERDFSEHAEQIGMVFQNPKTQFFTQDVYSELAFPMENVGMAQPEMVQRVLEVATEFNLTRFLEKSMFQLSGGEKQLVAFGSACTLTPKLFLLDEPSSNLDQVTVEKLKKYLSWLKSEGFTIIIAEHRLSYLMESADHFLFLPKGLHWTKEELLAKSPIELEELGLRQLIVPKLTLGQTDTVEESEVALTMKNLTYTYSKQQNGVTIPELQLSNQYITGLVGNNGAGKSTFAQLVTGLFKPKSGTIFLNGKKMTPKQLLKESYIVMQDVNLQLFFETVTKEITAMAKDLTDYEEVIEWLALEPLLNRHPQSLSGGEKQRVALAAAILSGKKILVFDEPTSGLDLVSMQKVSELIKKLKDKHLLVLVITHDQEFLQQTCDRVLKMNEGKIVSDGIIL